MTSYTKRGPFVDASPTGPYVDAGFFNNLETAVLAATNTTLLAPAPSGDTTGTTDQAALQPLITQAQSTAGTVVLQSGTYYVTGLSTVQSFNQPRILGQGMRQTVLTVVGTGAAITYVGGSGQPSGGLIQDLKITGTGGIGVMFAGCNHARVSRVWFKTLAVGVQFHNRDTGSFTEFCVAEDCSFDGDVTVPVHYKKTSGNESFHGSGVTGSIINQSVTATGPVIQIDAGCFPYGSPLSGTIFARTTTPLIQNANTSAARFSEFTGNLDLEVLGSPASVTLADPATTNGVLYAGTVTALGGSVLSYGGFQRVTQTHYSGGSTTTQGAMTTSAPVVSNSAAGTNIADMRAVSAALVQVQVTATNYYYEFTLSATRDKFSASGWVVTLANPRALNTAGYGAPTFTIANAFLVMTNTAFPASGVSCLVTRTPLAYSEVNN